MAHSVYSICYDDPVTKRSLVEMQVVNLEFGVTKLEKLGGSYVIYVNPGDSLEVKVNNLGPKNLPIFVTYGPEFMCDPKGVVLAAKGCYNTRHVWTPRGQVPLVMRIADLHRAAAHPLSEKPGDYGVLAVKIKDGPSLAVNVRDVRFIHPRG